MITTPLPVGEEIIVEPSRGNGRLGPKVKGQNELLFFDFKLK